MVLLKKKIKKYVYQGLIKSLSNISPLSLQKESEKKAILAYNRVRNLPYYREYFNKTNPTHNEISDISSFKKNVPIVDKQTVYTQSLTELFKNLNTEECANILLSSGSSGSFSFGIHSRQKIKETAQSLNGLFDHYFSILDKKTLIVNCLTAAVHLPVLDATVAEIGPRTDSLIYILKTLSPEFEQTILIGDNYFLKNSLEDGAWGGLNYSTLNVHLIVGGTYLPESLRAHLKCILKRQNSTGYTPKIYSSMGISEFGINLFFENDEMIRLRQTVESSSSLSQKLLNTDAPTYLPMFFNYFPQNFYLEEIEQNLIITHLDLQTPFPLIRYNTNDKGKIVSYEELVSLSLSEPQLKDLLPPFKSPLVLLYGKEEYITTGQHKIYPQQIQKGLYEDFEAASKTTGYFRLREDKGTGIVDIQLKKGIDPNNFLIDQFRQAVLKHIPQDLKVILYSYQNFPYGLALDYERKFKYI